jgi:hypothetical protein
MFLPTAVIISTAGRNVRREYNFIDSNDIWYVCCLEWIDWLIAVRIWGGCNEGYGVYTVHSVHAVCTFILCIYCV